MYYAYKLLEVEQAERAGKSIWKEFFTVRRNRRAAQSSFFVMFMQQFCGVRSLPLLPSLIADPKPRSTSSHTTPPPSSNKQASRAPKPCSHPWAQG
jgi:hypothetical protein